MGQILYSYCPNIDKIKYEKWDGKLPQVQGDGTTLIDISE